MTRQLEKHVKRAWRQGMERNRERKEKLGCQIYAAFCRRFVRQRKGRNRKNVHPENNGT